MGNGTLFGWVSHGPEKLLGFVPLQDGKITETAWCVPVYVPRARCAKPVEIVRVELTCSCMQIEQGLDHNGAPTKRFRES